MKKTNLNISLTLCIFLALILITGCSGNIKRTNNINIVKNITLSSLDVSESSKVQKELGVGSVFNIVTLHNTIETRFQKAGLKDINSQYHIKILINDVRYRSSITAVFFGFLAGNDHINGHAIINDNEGNVVNEFDVNTFYAFGGIAGGVAAMNDSNRMGWLYERFAELVLEGVVGEYKK